PEPYRWVSPPPNLAAGNKPPLPGEVTLPVQNGQVAGGGPQTGDSQVVMYFAPATFKAPSGAQSVKCTIEPLANPPAPPPGIDIRGNVYRITCVAQPGDGPVTVAGIIHLTMRFPPGAFKEIQYNDGSGWRAPRSLFLVGAGAVVFVSFLLVLRRPVARVQPTGDDLPPVPQTPSWPGWLMVLLALILVAGGLFGSQSTPDNVVVTAVWLVFWIAVPISVAIVGNYWLYISPLNVVARLVGPRARLAWPRSW